VDKEAQIYKGFDLIYSDKELKKEKIFKAG